MIMVEPIISSNMQDPKTYGTHARILRKCDGDVGDCTHKYDEELDVGFDDSRRILAQSRYISYGALQRNNVPCNVRGNSYYNCNSHQQANPYNRGCTQITHCARNNH
ncbi:protein RALF-like 22 [Primulina huaijiensis]|uniref:protein RALF-like 22 n=1 Tax=Primulina huaijiensis TaxID=1492673 RepID=UPI003CC713FC